MGSSRTRSLLFAVAHLLDYRPHHEQHRGHHKHSGDGVGEESQKVVLGQHQAPAQVGLQQVAQNEAEPRGA